MRYYVEQREDYRYFGLNPKKNWERNYVERRDDYWYYELNSKNYGLNPKSSWMCSRDLSMMLVIDYQIDY